MSRTFPGLAALATLVLVSGCESTPVVPVDAGSDSGSTERCRTDDDCDDERFCSGVETCDPGDPAADERGCVPDPEGDPCMDGQACDESADRCTTVCAVSEDADGDGARAMECGGDDCNDADPDRFPDNPEVCDLQGHDEDCDDTSVGARDIDGDGSIDAQCCNGETCGDDCNDLFRATNPGAPEVCDHLDNDCDGRVDEGGVTVMVWPDADFDLHGDASATPRMECAGTFGTATVGDDCDDSAPAIHPAQVEICDALDNDCDEDVDEAPSAVTWYRDADGDGFGSATETRVSCTPLPGFSLRATDCDDAAAGVNPGQIERCDGLDNDCNGRPDYILGPRDTEDDDLDGAADLECPSGTDCDDTDPTSFPAAAEICDLRDNDCNGMVDDGTAMGSWWPDRDGDSYGDEGATPIMSCTFVRGHITRGGDCDDSSELRRPGATEECDGVDEDCDTRIDEASERQPYYRDADGDGLGAGAPELACTMPSDRVANAVDCDDTSRAIGAARLWFVDADADGYGDPLRSELACTMPAGRIAMGGDCDDSLATTRPMGAERCGGADEDCDGRTDEDPAASAGCTLANATSACMMGSCGVAMCRAGFDDCNDSDADGCETTTSTDPLNCGMCGRACAMGSRCRAGECAAIEDVALGANFACVLLSSGEVACWGANAYGEGGRGALAGNLAPPARVSEYVQLHTGETLTDATAISTHSNGNSICALRATGSVVCWGHNDVGQCGADAPPSATRAYPVPGVAGATVIEVGTDHACAIVGTGRVLCWGSNGNGRLGSGATTPATTGTPLPMVETEGGSTREITDAVMLAAGTEHTCVVHAGGTRISCAGRNGSGGGWTGQLGRGTLPVGSYPIADDAVLPIGTTIVGIDAGSTHTCAVQAVGAPLCWGLNSYSPLGPRGAAVLTPVPLDLVLAETSAVSLGDDTTCVHYRNPTYGPRIACLGNDSNGQLGDGVADGGDAVLDDLSASADGSVRLDATGARVFAGYRTTAVLLANGALTFFGLNNAYVFGVTTPAQRSWCDASSALASVP